MSQETDKRKWPADMGDPESLPIEIEPPKALEDRVVNALLDRGLIRANRGSSRHSVGWRAVRASLAAATCVALVAVGVLIGRSSITDTTSSIATLTGAESNLYALLLFETPGYDRPTATEAMQRYGEYSQWIAYARERDQFVTGEDLEVEEGWLLAPAENDVTVSEVVTVDGSVPLSGVLFIRAEKVEEAIEIAKVLPHIRHGGSVIVQKTIRTDVPPDQR